MFAEALKETIRRLDEAKINRLLADYALIGGFAVSAWGVPRATQDLDFALVLGTVQPEALARHLKAEFYLGDSDDPLRGMFQLSVSVKNHRIPIQLVLFPPSWNPIIFQGVESLAIFDCSVPVVSWQTLILLKMYAGGPQDLLDVQQILAVRQPNSLERTSLETCAEKVGLLEIWQNLGKR